MEECTKENGPKIRSMGMHIKKKETRGWLTCLFSYGTMTLANGEKIQGHWTNNLLNGMAIFTSANNGERFEEYYKDGIQEDRKPLKRKGHEMDALLQAQVPPVWVPDAYVYIPSVLSCGIYSFFLWLDSGRS